MPATTYTPRILVTSGEPAGIGPDITIRIAQQSWPAEIIVVADPNLLLERAKQIGLPLKLINAELDLAPKVHQPGTLKIHPIPLKDEVIPGKLNPHHSAYVIQTLTTATALVLEKKATAIVTGPVHKGIINQANIAFSGHTEFFAQCCNVEQTVMLFVVDDLKVALATTHIPLSKVSEHLTKEKLKTVISILNEELKRKFHLNNPRISVCGLNPHAGEGGYLGTEEIDVITPVLKELRHQNYQLTGPLPADTIFTPKHLREADAILAMYHDQALPVVKYIGFSHAINVTLGLPFVRTSVDHGTALDIAGTKNADPGSLTAALQLAIKLSTNL